MNSSQTKPAKSRTKKSWLETRWPFSAVVRWSTVEEISGGSRFAYALGSATLFLFVLQVLTGVWELLYYVPTVDHAYRSVTYLRLQVPFGWLVHGLHYWGANAFIVVMGLHLIRVFIWGAYKKPRELTWIAGVVLLLLGASLIFTGAILPWDMLGYWAGEVGTSIAGTVPLVGGFLKLLMRGEASMGQSTLSRSFVAHAAILPALTFLFIAIHVVAFRQFGSVGPWNPDRRRRSGPFWPNQVYKDLWVASVVVMVLVGLSAFAPAPITGPADPLDSSYTPKPEWNFLFLYEALKVFKGPWERVGTVVIPLFLIALLFALPFIDRNERRNPLKRPWAMAGGFVFVGGILALTIVGYYSNPGKTQATGGGTSGDPPAGTSAPSEPAGGFEAEPPPELREARAAGRGPRRGGVVFAAFPTPIARTILLAATDGSREAKSSQGGDVQVAANGSDASGSHASVEKGKALFTSARCSACHMINDQGGTIGPDLSHLAQQGRSRSWLRTQILDPRKHDPSTIMPAAQSLTDQQLNDLIDYLLNPSAAGNDPAIPAAAARTPGLADRRKNPVPANAKSIAAGESIYQGQCMACHGRSGKGNGPASLALRGAVSDLSAPVMAEYTDGALFRIVTYGLGGMPAFESLLSPTHRWEVINYVRTLGPKPKVPETQASAEGATRPRGPAGPSGSKAATRSSAGEAESQAARAEATAPPGATSAAPKSSSASSAPATPADLGAGRKLFTSAHCDTCHKIGGKGGDVGPDLSKLNQSGHSASWIRTQIMDPAKHDPNTIMPATQSLTSEQLNDLVAFLLNPSGAKTSATPSTEATAAAPPQPSAPTAKTTTSRQTRQMGSQAVPEKAPPPAEPSAKVTQESGQSRPDTGAGSVNLAEGRMLFTSAHCDTCHKIDGKGGDVGPDLSKLNQSGHLASWIRTQIVDPAKHDPNTIMPATQSLTSEQLDNLLAFLLNPSGAKTRGGASEGTTSETAKPQTSAGGQAGGAEEKSGASRAAAATQARAAESAAVGKAASYVGDPTHGRVLYTLDCKSCHGADGQGGVPNPGSAAGKVPALSPIAASFVSSDPLQFAENVDRVIQHGATPAGANPILTMPAFGTTGALTQEQIANIEAYVLQLNGVNRAEILHAGVEPARFFAWTLGGFALALALTGALWLGSRGRMSTESAAGSAPPWGEDHDRARAAGNDSERELGESEGGAGHGEKANATSEGDDVR